MVSVIKWNACHWDSAQLKPLEVHCIFLVVGSFFFISIVLRLYGQCNVRRLNWFRHSMQSDVLWTMWLWIEHSSGISPKCVQQNCLNSKTRASIWSYRKSWRKLKHVMLFTFSSPKIEKNNNNRSGNSWTHLLTMRFIALNITVMLK